VFAFELAAMRIQALAAFFSPAVGDAARKRLICKEMGQKQAYFARFRGEQTLTKGVYCRAHGGCSRG
jgi:hypothetical protein